MRALLVAIFCVAAAFCSQNHELWIGKPSEVNGDVIIYEAEGYKYRTSRVVKSIIDFPPPNASDNAVITAICVDGKGYPTYVRILEGGVGHRNVKLELSSGKKHGINFKVTIFGSYYQK